MVKPVSVSTCLSKFQMARCLIQHNINSFLPVGSVALVLGFPWSPPSRTYIHAVSLGHKVVTASSTARVEELFTRPGDGVVVVAWYGSSTLADVQRTLTQHRCSFMWSAVLHAGLRIIEAVVVALAAPVIEGLALHGGHVEVIA